MVELEFIELHREANRRLFAFVASRLGYASATDVVADVFEVAWRKRAVAPPTLDAQVGWVFGIAKNKIRQERRRSALRRTRRLDATEPAVTGDLADAVAAADLGARLFRSLSPSDQRLFDLLFIRGVGRDAACEMLGITVQALHTRSSRLRARIEAMTVDLEASEGEATHGKA